MANQQTVEQFTGEFERRFHALIQWAVENWPDKNNPLDAADFAVANKEFTKIIAKTGHAGPLIPEPAQGGPQYVSVDPTPWP